MRQPSLFFCLPVCLPVCLSLPPLSPSLISNMRSFSSWTPQAPPGLPSCVVYTPLLLGWLLSNFVSKSVHHCCEGAGLCGRYFHPRRLLFALSFLKLSSNVVFLGNVLWVVSDTFLISPIPEGRTLGRQRSLALDPLSIVLHDREHRTNSL